MPSAHSRRPAGQRWDAVDLAIEHVDGVGALMDHHAPWAVAKTAPSTTRGQENATLPPAHVSPRRASCHSNSPPPSSAGRSRHEIIARIDEHGFEAVDELVGEPQHSQPRLPRDRHRPYLVGDLETAAALERLLGEEHGDPAAAAAPAGVRRATAIWRTFRRSRSSHAAGPRPLADRPSPPCLQPREHGRASRRRLTAAAADSRVKSSNAIDHAGDRHRHERDGEHRGVDVASADAFDDDGCRSVLIGVSFVRRL